MNVAGRTGVERLGSLGPLRAYSLAGIVFCAALAVLLVPSSHAAAPLASCPFSTIFSGYRCLFDDTGSEQALTIPAGVSQVSVEAQGSAGQAGSDGELWQGPSLFGVFGNICSEVNSGAGGQGGFGDTVSAVLPVTPGESLYIEVDGAAPDDRGGSGNSGYFGGPPPMCTPSQATEGGAGGAGGGASDVRTCSTDSTCTVDSRLVVAAGGGGGGGGGCGPFACWGGQAGGESSGGLGDGAESTGAGGDGGSANSILCYGGGGGGGGGGYRGGTGGAAGDCFASGGPGGSGGSGGSDLVPPGGTTLDEGQNGPGHVTITYYPTTTATALSSSENPAPFGDSVTLTANVTESSGLTPGAGDGTVTFRDGSTALATVPVGAGGVASITASPGLCLASCDSVVSALSAGTHSITAVYSGAGAFEGSTSPALAQVVYEPGATISISPGTAGEVGTQQTFTVKLTATSGLSQAGGGAGAVPVTLGSIVPSVSPAPTSETDTCGSPTVSGDSETCTITITNSTAGTFTVGASGRATVGPVALNPATGDGVNGDSASATATFVDATVSVAPAASTATTGVSSTFTVTLTATPAGLSPSSFSIAPTVSPKPSSETDTCATPTISGQTATCTITIDSASAGTFTISVSGKVTIGGVQVSRATGDGKSGDSPSAVAAYVVASIAVAIDAQPQTVASGSAVSFAVAVTNTGGATLDSVTVADPLAPDCAKTSADIASLAALAANAHVTYTCTVANVTAGFTDVATASGTPETGGPDVSASDTAAIAIAPPAVPPSTPTSTPTAPSTASTATSTAAPPATQPSAATGSASRPAISIVELPGSQSTAVGGTAAFKITVRNTGDVTLPKVAVSSSHASGCDRSLGALAAGASRSYSCAQSKVDAGFVNVVTATGTPPSGPKVSASDSAAVTVAPLRPATIAKHAKTAHHTKKTKTTSHRKAKSELRVKAHKTKSKFVSHHTPKTTG